MIRAQLLAVLILPAAVLAQGTGMPPTDVDASSVAEPHADTQCHRADDPDVMAAIAGAPALALAETGGEGGRAAPRVQARLPLAVPFTRGDDGLAATSMELLDAAVPSLKAALASDPQLSIEVVGRSADRLSPRLAQTRAQIVRAYLMGRGLSSGRLRVAQAHDPAGGVELREAN